MINTEIFSKSFIQKIKTTNDVEIIQQVKIGQTNKQNELVFFIKPELLDVEENEKILNSFEIIREKFDDFKVEIDGAAIIPGAVLKEYGIMNRHYGFINQLSRKASSIVDEESRQRIFITLGIEDRDQYKILGGHEFLKTFDADVDTLSDIWFAQTANKLRSGFYFIADTYKGQPFILVNGFHPSQLRHFTRADHKILLMLIHTDTDWYDLKFEMVGDTFPENAKPDSIRGRLYKNPERFGQAEVGINTNGVHLSAGPFEAAYEVVNFFGPLIDLNPEVKPPLAILKAIESGIQKQKALSLMDNPTVDNSDLFSETENLNTEEAVAFAKSNIS
jgi:hypothetical protein